MAALHNMPEAVRQPSETDQKTAKYIEEHGGLCYDAALEGEEDFQVFFQLSELRTGLISWYDFGEAASVLEIGAGFGALTGRLCQMCGHVTATERSPFRAQMLAKRLEQFANLDVYAGDIAELEFEERFDFIVLTGLLERIGGGSRDRAVYSGYLKKLVPFLKSNGRILIAVENRFGLRYFCGAVEPHTNCAFDGINGYKKGGRGRSFSRQELTEILRQAGLDKYKFYYPLPDYKLPQLVYTDSFLPEENLSERLIPYYSRNDTLVARESDLYDEIVRNGVFPFFANSFLVECSLDGTFCDVEYAAVSTDRGAERSFATTIHANGTVRKQPLYPQGIESAGKLYENIMDLQAHGIPVVPHSWKDGDGKCGTLQLPYIKHPTLSNYIKKLLPGKIEEFESLVERIYQYILQSSEEAPAGQNALAEYWEKELGQVQGAGKAGEGAAEKAGEDAVRNAAAGSLSERSWGPVLRRAYMELIPLNCFYDAEQGEFLYFDQEFVRENYPAKYVLFRAIHYIYCFTPGAESCYPRKKLLEKYDMEDTWDIYMKEEDRFLDEVRNHRQYSQFYKWAWVDDKRISDNARRLESEEEKIADYTVSNQMKKVWKVELRMLDEVDRICKKYGLTYFFVHGSLLGAVRHKGFIPWDDDLDIAMLREDYDRFLAVAEGELPEGLSLHTAATEADVFWGGFARIRDGRTTAMESREMGHKANLGIWIDILPIDTATSDEKKFYRQQLRIRRCHRLFLAKTYGRDFKRYWDMNAWQWRWYRLLAAGFSRGRLAEKLEKAMALYRDEDSDEVAILSGYFKHRRLVKKDFEGTVLLDFEHRKVPAPAGYESYLFRSLGKDYMRYPPEEERKPKHDGIWNPDEPYEKYVKLLCDIFKDCKGKKIILFGSGMMFEDYMKKYGGKYRPSFLVDNDDSKWEKRRMGIEIKKPEAILEVPENRRKLIICSYYYPEIEKQLQEMGVTDYQIYVQRLEWILEAEKAAAK